MIKYIETKIKYIETLKEKFNFNKFIIPTLAIIIAISTALLIIYNFNPSISDKIPSFYKSGLNTVLVTCMIKPFWIIVELKVKKSAQS